MRWVVGWENEIDKQQPYIVRGFQTAKNLLSTELKWLYLDTGDYEYLLAQHSLNKAACEWQYTTSSGITFFIKDWATTLEEDDN